jgi:hypothetical protein
MNSHPLSFILGVRHGDVPDELLERVDALHVEVVWWWGTLGRLDSHVHLAHHAPSSLGRLERETIAEVCAWDLNLSLRLCEEWDGDPRGLAKAVEACQGGTQSADVDPTEGRVHSASERPPQESRVAWNAGFLDLWDGCRRGAANPSQTRSAAWRAQCAVLLPRLDDHRRRIQKEFWSKASRTTLLELLNHGSTPGSREYLIDLPSVGDAVLEFGDMYYACRTRRVRLDPGTHSELLALREIRNALAHGQPAPDDDFRAVRHLFD